VLASCPVLPHNFPLLAGGEGCWWGGLYEDAVGVWERGGGQAVSLEWDGCWHFRADLWQRHRAGPPCAIKQHPTFTSFWCSLAHPPHVNTMHMCVGFLFLHFCFFALEWVLLASKSGELCHSHLHVRCPRVADLVSFLLSGGP